MMLNDTHMLVTDEDGTEIRAGEPVTTFRDEVTIFRYISRAPEPGKSGKVMTDFGYEMYPQVFGCKIRVRQP